MSSLNKLINKIEKKIDNPSEGLPEDIFKFISRITPLINVDLLIQNKNKGTLLTWRKAGEKYAAGWHIPGGIIRIGEKLHKRLNEVAKNELGAKINFKKNVKEVNEIHLTQKNRRHFVSLLYECKLKTKLKRNFDYRKKGKLIQDAWCWFKKPPKKLIKSHNIYKKYIK